MVQGVARIMAGTVRSGSVVNMLPAIVVFALLLPGGTSSPSLTIEPLFAHQNFGDTFKVLCKANVSIEECHFKDTNDKTNMFYNLSLGDLSTTSDNYKYHGSGLANGECGIEIMLGNGVPNRVIGCRVRAKRGGWKYADTALTITKGDVGSLQREQAQKDVEVLLPNQPLRLLFALNPPRHLNFCWFNVPGRTSWLNFNEGAKSKNITNYAYSGTGLETSQCGLKIGSVSEKHNGWVWAWMEVLTPHLQDYARTTIIIATLPAETNFTIFNYTTLSENDTLTATCTSSGSRPVANMTWYLGDEILRQDDIDDSPISSTWLWNFENQSISQTITRNLTQQDNGKILTCEIQHFAIPGQKLQKKKTLYVHFGDGPREPIPNEDEEGTSFKKNGTTAVTKLHVSPLFSHQFFGSNVTVLCKTNVSLLECHFKDSSSKSQGWYDLSLGNQSITNSTYKYYGSGLASGQCGIILVLAEGPPNKVIGCRVRSYKGGWMYADSVVSISKERVGPIQREKGHKSTEVVLPGQRLRLLYAMNPPRHLKFCWYHLPTKSTWLNFNNGHRSKSVHNYAYTGSGLDVGQCGLKIVTISNKHNGWVWSWMEVLTPHLQDYARTTVIVAVEPGETKLISNGQGYVENDTLSATCTSSRSRPVANITWYLGDEIVRQDNIDDSPINSTWLWNYDYQSISQTVTRELTWQDNGKVLICEIQHLAIPEQKIRKRKTIHVHYGDSPRQFNFPPDEDEVIQRNVSRVNSGIDGDEGDATVLGFGVSGIVVVFILVGILGYGWVKYKSTSSTGHRRDDTEMNTF